MGTRRNVYVVVDRNYYDVKDILACKQNLRCVFSNALPAEIFHLIGQSAPDMEESYCEADLPFFMVRTLPHRRIIPPVEFSQLQLDILRAAPEHVDIMHLNQFFFILSKHLTKLMPNEKGRTVAEVTLYSYLQRCSWIIRCALNQSVKLKKIDFTEIELYEETLNSALQFINWFHSRQAISRIRENCYSGWI